MSDALIGNRREPYETSKSGSCCRLKPGKKVEGAAIGSKPSLLTLPLFFRETSTSADGVPGSVGSSQVRLFLSSQKQLVKGKTSLKNTFSH